MNVYLYWVCVAPLGVTNRRFRKEPMHFESLLLYVWTNSAYRNVCLQLTYNFQQWMSWLAHRWRTLRTAIRNANCRIQWVIKILNAYCTSGLVLGVCLYQCPWILHCFMYLKQNVKCLVSASPFKWVLPVHPCGLYNIKVFAISTLAVRCEGTRLGRRNGSR